MPKLKKFLNFVAMDAKKEKYEKLRVQLSQSSTWPSLYMFKFIVPADNGKIAQVEQLFNTEEAQIQLRQSRKGNFVSVTAKEVMISPEKVIERYIEAEGIEGLISL
ncbi:MAG: putative lipoic acid-binding regulatory protein [Roseivirga sp.]